MQTAALNKTDETAKPNPFKKGHVNHINVEEVMGTFSTQLIYNIGFYLILDHRIYSYQEHL
jgi:hypothetical protein